MNQDGPSLIIEAPPPPPPGPHLAKDVKKKISQKCSSDYLHILHIVELWCDFKMFVGP